MVFWFTVSCIVDLTTWPFFWCVTGVSVVALDWHQLGVKSSWLSQRRANEFDVRFINPDIHQRHRRGPDSSLSTSRYPPTVVNEEDERTDNLEPYKPSLRCHWFSLHLQSTTPELQTDISQPPFPPRRLQPAAPVLRWSVRFETSNHNLELLSLNLQLHRHHL